MANSGNITFGVLADTTQAKKSINDLLKTLSKVQNINLDTLGIDSQLSDAADAAKELSVHLKSATNAQTGKINLVELDNSLKMSNQSLGQLIAKLADGGAVGQQAFQQMAAAIANTQVPIKQTNKLMTNMLTTLKNTAKWEFSSNIVHGIEKAFSGAISYVTDLNASLTDIRIVTGKSTDDMAKFAEQANVAARELSTTTKAYTEAALIYYQQGDTADEVAKKTAITIKAANASFGSTAKEMSEYLTAVWNSYQVGSDKLESYVDVMAALGAKTATSLEEIATAMQKVAATANTVGVSMEQMSSIIATVSSVTREAPESIGTSFKTILARVGDLKLGNTAEDGVTLGTVSSQLKTIGVQVLDAQNNLRDMGDIITDIGDKWQYMTSAEKTAVAQVIAGKRQYTQLMALFDNWDMFNANLDISENAGGSLQKMTDTYSEGIEALQAKLQNAKEGLYSSLIDDKAIASFTKGMTTIIDNITNMVNALGGLGGILHTVSGLLLSTFSSKIGATIKQMGQNITSILKGSQENQYLGVLDKTKNELQFSNSVKHSYANDMMQQEIELKTKLLTIQDSLTQKEQEFLQARLSGFGESIAQLNTIEQEYTHLETTLQALTKTAQNFANMKPAQGASFETLFGSHIQNGKLKVEGYSGDITGNTGIAYTRGSTVTNAMQQQSKLANINNTAGALQQSAQSITDPASEESLKKTAGYLEQIQTLVKGTNFESYFSTITEESLKSQAGMQKFIETLEQVKVESQTDMSALNDAFNNALQSFKDPQIKDQITEIWGKFQTGAYSAAEASKQMQMVLRGVTEEEKRLQQELEKANQKWVGFVSSLGSLASAISTGYSATQSFYTALKNINSGASNFEDNIGSMIMSLTMAITTVLSLQKAITGLLGVAAGPTGMAISAIITAGFMLWRGISGVIEGQREKIEKEAREKAEKAAEKSQEKSDKNAEEEDNKAKLVKQYTTLYQTYKRTGEGQAELTKSAYELAEAYGVVGANLLIAEGNFEGFNTKMKQTFSYQKQITDEQNNIQQQVKALGLVKIGSGVGIDKSDDTAINSIYLKENKAVQDFILNLSGQYGARAFDSFGDALLNKINFITSPFGKNYKYSEEEIIFAVKELFKITGTEIPENFDTDLENYITDVRAGTIKSDSQQPSWITDNQQILKNLYFSNNEPSLLQIQNGQKAYVYREELPILQWDQSTVDKYDKLFDSQGKLQWDDLDDLAKVSQYQYALELTDDIKTLQANIQNKLDTESDTLTQDEKKIYNGYLLRLQSILNNLKLITDNTDIASYVNNIANSNVQIDAYRLNEQFLNSIFDLNEVSTTLSEFNNYMQNVANYIDDNIGAFQTLKQYLEENENGDISIDGKTYSVIAGKEKQFEAAKAELLRSFVETYTPFDDYLKIYEDVIARFADSFSQDVAFKSLEKLGVKTADDINSQLLTAIDFVNTNDSISGTKALRKKYINYLKRYNSDFTGDLSDDEIFLKAQTAQSDIPSFDDYVNNKIKWSINKEQVSYEDFQANMIKYNPLVQSVENALKTKKAISSTLTSYNEVSAMAEQGTKDLTMDQAADLYEAYTSLGDAVSLSWEQFVALDVDSRKSYLEYINKKSISGVREALNSAKNAAEENVAEWENTLKESYGGIFGEEVLTEESVNTAITNVDISRQSFKKWAISAEQGYSYDSENNRFTDKNGNIADADTLWQSYLSTLENGSSYTYKYSDIDNIINAGYSWLSAFNDSKNYTNQLKGLDIIEKQGESLSERFTKASEALSALSSGLQDFIKYGKLSAEVMALLQKNGIGPAKIKTTQDYINAMQELLEIQREISNQSKKDYRDEYGVAYDPEKIWSKEEIEANKPQYESWLAIKQTENEYDANFKELFSTKTQLSEDALEKQQSRSDEAIKKAEKTWDIGSTLADKAISGELSFEEMVTLPEEVAKAWDSAATAEDRAIVAGQQLTEAAIANAKANEIMANTYNNASEIINKVAEESWFQNGEKGFASHGKDIAVAALKEHAQLTEEQTGAVSKAWDSLLDKGFDFASATDKQVLQALAAELEEMGVEVNNETLKMAAQAKDIMKDLGQQLAQEHIDAAQTAAEAWLDAFQTIADARKTLFSGGNLLDEIAGDPEKLMQYVLSSGMKPKEIGEKIMQGTLQADDLKYGQYQDYVDRQRSQYGFDNTYEYHGKERTFGTLSIYSDVRALGYKKKGDKYFKTDGSGEALTQEETQQVNGQLETFYRNILSAGTNYTSKEIDELIKQIMAGSASAYLELKRASGKLIDSFEITAKALELQTQHQEALAAAQQASQDVLAGKSENKTQFNGVDIGSEEELNNLIAAIASAQSLKSEGKSFIDLSKEEQTILEKFNINSLENLDSYSQQAADALASLKQAAYTVAKSILENKGYTFDEETGLWGFNAEEDGPRYTSQEITDAMKALEEGKTTAENQNTDTARENQNRSATEYGFASATEQEEYTQRLVEIGEIVDKNGNQLAEYTDEEKKLASELRRTEKGFSDAKSGLEGWTKDLKEADKKSATYTAALKSMRAAYADIFNLSDTGKKALSESFLASEENAELLQKAIEGDNEAYDQLQANVAKEVTANISIGLSEDELNAFIDYLSTYDFGDLKVGATIDDSFFNEQLSKMIANSYEAAQSMSDALSSMGVDAKLVKHEVLTDGSERLWNTSGQMVDADGNLVDVSAQAVMSSAPVKETYWTLEGARYNGRGVTGGSAASSGGGGGGGKAKKLDKKKPEDEKERYHHVNKTLDRLSDQLDEIDKRKSRVYGQSYLDYIEKEIALTEQQCDTYQRYIDEAREYLSLDRERVASLGATFDDFGNIENYDQVMDNIINKYNEFIDKYNSMNSDEQEAADEEKTKWDEWYDEKKKWIENYEDTISTIYEQQNNLLDAQNKISEKTLEGIQYKIEVHVDLTDAEKEFLNYLNDTYDELLEKQGQVMDNLVSETTLAVSNLEALGKAKEELDAALASGKLNSADYTEGLKDLNSQILDNLSNIQDLKKQIQEFYGNTLDKASEAFTQQTDKIKSASDAMSSYISILGAIGKGSNLKELTKFYDAQYEYNLQSLQSQQQYLEILKQEEQYYLERLDSADGLTETERQQYEDLEKTISDVNSNILSDTKSTLDQITEAFNNEIEIIFKDLEERIAGVGNSMQDLSDAYQYYQEEQSRYVTSAKELYEVNKLNRQIEQTMNETTSKVNKNLLAALQERINKQSELNELTEYDIQMNQLQYELLLKKIALEEAQNAKNTVRLTRDSGGNYVYQYTADQNEIAQKQQEYEDVLQQINELAVGRVQDLESQLLEIYTNTLSKIKEIAQDQTLTEEEKYDKIQTIMNQFKEQTNFIQEQYQIASDNLITSNLAISKHYGEQLVEHSENAKNGLNQTIAAMIENTSELQKALEDACANQIPAAMDTMQSRIDAVTSAVGLNYNTMADSVNNYNKVTKDAQDQTAQTADTLDKELLPALHDITQAWDVYMAKLKDVIDTYENMYQAIMKAIEAQSKLSTAVGPTYEKVEQGNGEFTDDTMPKSEKEKSNDAGGSGGSGGGNNGDKTKVSTSGGPKLTPSGKEWHENYKTYATGGLADFTGPAWLDGTKTRPEIVLNANDTENLLTAVQGVRALDASTLSMLNKYITNATLAMSFGLGGISAGSVYGSTDTIQQEVHITAEFPNATNSAEIQDAFDNIINRATQYITTRK